MGFVAVAAGFPVTALVIWALIRSPLATRVAAHPRADRWHEQPTPMVGGIGIFAGLFSLGPLPKLAAQLGAAAIVIFNGVTISGLISSDLLAGVVALVWLVGMTNAFNLLDNMDGLAATLAGIAAVFFAIDAVTVHSNDAVLALALALAVACAAFLPFNLRPRTSAVAFMGDSGSQVLGFALAALGLTASWKVAGTTVATLLLPILV